MLIKRISYTQERTSFFSSEYKFSKNGNFVIYSIESLSEGLILTWRELNWNNCTAITLNTLCECKDIID